MFNYIYNTDGTGDNLAPLGGNSLVYQVEDANQDGILQVGEGFELTRQDYSVQGTYLGAAGKIIVVQLSNTGETYLLSVNPLQFGVPVAWEAVDFSLTDLDVIPCFLAGTLIRTARGDVAVEDLTQNDQLVTLSGRLAPLVWIGHRKLSPRLVAAAPAKSLPVRFVAGCLAPGLPARDLWLSPDHCLHHDGVLVQAKTLVNGTTVTQEDPSRAIVYHHLLLDRHDVVFAEGVGAESYRPCNNIFGFHNAETFPADVERNQPRASGCFPVRKSGAEFEALQMLLLKNAPDCEPAAAKAA